LTIPAACRILSPVFVDNCRLRAVFALWIKGKSGVLKACALEALRPVLQNALKAVYREGGM
jgi:hypothetical protein